MVRVFRHRQKWGVYVGREVGERHHLPHAHIQVRRKRVASVFLLTLEYYFVLEDLPSSLLDEIRERQEELLAMWEDVNA
jgi:hypothetical protein